MFDPAPSAVDLVDRVYAENGPYDDRYAAVAAATGYPIHEVRSRGVTFCRQNPRDRGDEFDQSLPSYVHASVDRGTKSADAGPELSSFAVDFFRDAVAEPYRRGVDLRDAFPDADDFAEARQALLDEGELTVGGGASGEPVILRPSSGARSAATDRADRLPAAAQSALVAHEMMEAQRTRPFGEEPALDARLPVSVRRDPVKGGVAIVCRLGLVDIIVSPALDDAAADALERAYRAAAEAFRREAPAGLPLAG